MQMDSSMTTFGAITSRERQRRSFFDNLFRELDKMAAVTDSENASLRDAAEAYFADGVDGETCVDLLILDGFPTKSARDYVRTRVEAAELKTNATYDFMFKDHRGRLIRGMEIGRSVEATNDSEALSKATEIMSTVEPSVEVIEVSKIC